MPVVAKRSGTVSKHYEWALRVYSEVCSSRDLSDEEVVKAAFEKLESRYKPSTVAYIWKICKARISGWPKELKHQYSPADVFRPTMAEKDVAAMIRAMGGRPNEDPIKTYLVLSTTYGLRCTELASVQEGDIDLEAGTFFARTAKGGVQRTHLVPEEIRPHLEGARIKPVNVKVVHRAWLLVEQAAGLGHRARYGWHSVRRAVNTALGRSQLNPLVAKKFLRWRDTGMAERYTVLDYSVDREVFNVHPFIKYWRQK